MDVRVIRSCRRRKTVSARLVRDTLVVSAPADLPGERLQIFIADFTARFQRRRLREALNRDGGLESRARELNDRYFGSALRWDSIEYVTGQERKYGCCDCRAGRIRISHRVGAMPGWVSDYVIVHELAHLKVPRHDRAFWDLVARYPLAERARGFLIAVGVRDEEDLPDEGGPPPAESPGMG